MLWKPSANFVSCVHRRRFALRLIWLLKICDTLPTLDCGLNSHPNKLIVETDRNSEELQGDWEGRPRGRAWIISGTQKTYSHFKMILWLSSVDLHFMTFCRMGRERKGINCIFGVFVYSLPAPNGHRKSHQEENKQHVWEARKIALLCAYKSAQYLTF